jgi:hypothetical protein
MRKKDRKILDDVLQRLETGIRYVNDEKTAIMRKNASNSNDFFSSTHYPDDRYYIITKEAGSPLSQLFNAKRRLEDYLNKEREGRS